MRLYLCSFIHLCFFFKQKTAYEMRISDWSSDVCSSDLPGFERIAQRLHHELIDMDRLAERMLFVEICHTAEHPVPGERAAEEDQRDPGIGKIGRASCRARVCQYV